MKIFGLRTYAFRILFLVAFSLLTRGDFKAIVISAIFLIVFSLFTTIIIARGSQYVFIPLLFEKRTTIELDNIRQAVVTMGAGKAQSTIDFSFKSEIRSKNGIISSFKHYGDFYAVKRIEKDLKEQGIPVIESKRFA
jgi:nitrate/nitrite transporter NarK